MTTYRHVLAALILVCTFVPASAPFDPAFAQSVPREPIEIVAVDPNYQFGPEDVLQIEVWGRPDLGGMVSVDLQGQVLIPLVGAVRAEGRNAAELSAVLAERYQLIDPSVSEVIVAVAQYNSRSLTIHGEVRKPGRVGFREVPSLLEAIYAAGGPTAEAELALVQIVRHAPRADESHTLVVDLSRGLENLDPATLPELRAKDQIIVPSVEEIPIGGDKINVLGAVNSPGVYRMVVARNVVEALTASGGFTPDAQLDKVYLTRVTALGAVAYQLDIEHYLKSAQPLSNMELLPGDTITVMEKSSFWMSLGEFLSRLAPFVSLAVTVMLATD